VIDVAPLPGESLHLLCNNGARGTVTEMNALSSRCGSSCAGYTQAPDRAPARGFDIENDILTVTWATGDGHKPGAPASDGKSHWRREKESARCKFRKRIVTCQGCVYAPEGWAAGTAIVWISDDGTIIPGAFSPVWRGRPELPGAGYAPPARCASAGRQPSADGLPGPGSWRSRFAFPSNKVP